MEELQPEARRHLTRNYVLGVLNGGIFSFGDALQDTNLVLSVFVSRLSGSNVLVGFLQPIRLGGWFLPQLLLSGHVQGAPAKLPYYRLAAAARISAAFGLAIAALTVRHSGLLLVLIFLFLAAFSLMGGLSGIAFMDIVAKTIPSRSRGRYFAWRMFLGGVLALGGSFIIRHVLSQSSGLSFPTNYGVLFLLGAVAIAVSMTAFALVREPADGKVQPRASLLHQLRRASSLPRRDHNYRNFLLARIFLMVAEIASPFYIIYASSVMGLPASLAGTYLLVSTVASVSSTYFWGQMSDRTGNRAVIRLVCALGAGAPALGLAALPLSHLWSAQAQVLSSLVFGAVFVLLGVSRTGMTMGGMAFLLDVAPPDDRPIYLGFTNTLIGVASLANVFGGVLIEAFSYQALFALALVLYLVAGVAISRAAEPRGLQAAEEGAALA